MQQSRLIFLVIFKPNTGPKVVSSIFPNIPMAHHVNETIVEFEKLRVECKHSSNVIKLHMLFNIADVGGQPAFLDMLPSLTIGPALYILFSQLVNDSGDALSIDDFIAQQTVKYRTRKDEEPHKCFGYTYSQHDVLFSALSSIACFGLPDKEIEKYITKESEDKKTSSLTMLLGTFADKIDEVKNSQLINTESALKKFLESSDFCRRNLISFPNPHHPEHYNGQVFFRVNNKTGSQKEIAKHRSIIEGLVKEKFGKYEIPTAWFGLGICLRILANNKETYKVSLKDCVQMGQYFNMTEEMVKAALNFLHKYVGLVMYFPKDNHLKHLVICNPQVVFSSISELIFNVYDSTSRTGQLIEVSAQQKRFEQTGIFTPESVNYVSPEKSSEFLSIYDLVHLLVHLNIAAEITSPINTDGSSVLSEEDVKCSSSSVHENREYFLPAILRTAEVSSLSMAPRGLNEELLPEPLCIGFQTGYIPMGFTCALSARLIAEEDFKLSLDEPVLYKNKLTFRFDGQFNITMISLPLRCEFHVTRHYGNLDFHDCCPEIMKIICKAADSTLKSMQRALLSENCYCLAFKCPNHQNPRFGHEALAKFVYSNDSFAQLKLIECLECGTKIYSLKPEMKVWFGEVRVLHVQYSIAFILLICCCLQSLVIPLSITKQPTVRENRILIQAEGSKPMRYQWLKDDEELSDGNDHQGSTTPELVIVGTGPQVKGNYKCRIAHKYGEITSIETDYGKL